MKKILLCCSLLMAGSILYAQQADNTLSKAEKKQGWKLLFDGKTAAGWRAFNGSSLPGSWVIEEGTLKGHGASKDDTGGDIVYGAEAFENFEFSIDWKLTTGGNSGIFYHVVEGKNYKAPYYSAPEYQLIDDIGYPGKLEDWQQVGADYAMYTAPADKNMKPAGEWNNSRIVFTKEKVTYYLNGKETVSFVPWSEAWTKRRNSGKWKEFPEYGSFKTGLIALQDHGSPAWFKNIKIRKL